MARTRKRIGILGGTFNPIHLGHLIIAQDALEGAGLDCVKFVPAATPPHKQLAGNVDAKHRLAMVRLAIKGFDGFEVDDLEIRRGGRSYSVETLMELRQRYPRAELCFIIGSDSLRELHTWRDAQVLAELCRFVVALRPGSQPRIPAKLRGKVRVTFVRSHVCDIASTDIRERAAKGLSIQQLVPDAVFRYSRRHRLYSGKGNEDRRS